MHSHLKTPRAVFVEVGSFHTFFFFCIEYFCIYSEVGLLFKAHSVPNFGMDRLCARIALLLVTGKWNFCYFKSLLWFDLPHRIGQILWEVSFLTLHNQHDHGYSCHKSWISATIRFRVKVWLCKCVLCICLVVWRI